MGPPPAPWVVATGNLAGKSVAEPGVAYLAAKPDEDMLVAGVSDIGLWASEDGGENWDALGAAAGSLKITHFNTSIVFDPERPDVFWETGVYNGGGLFQTTDRGKTFTQLGVGILDKIDYVSPDFSDPERSTMLVGWHEESQKVFRTLDGGENWENVGTTVPATCGFSANPLLLDSETYLLGCVKQIARTEDGGDTWKIVSSAGGYGPPVVASDGSIYWLIELGYGLMRSTDDGKTWKRMIGEGTIERDRALLLELPDGRLATAGRTEDNARSVLISDDHGTSWEPIGSEMPYMAGSLVYSAQQKAFYISTGSPEPRIPENSIMRMEWDYETE